MEREGERPRIQGKSLSAISRRERSGEGVLFAGKLLSALLAVVLAAGLLPIVPASPVVEEAEAFEGTTNYQGYFTPAQIAGKYGYVSGNVLYASSTSNSNYYKNSDGAGKWLSSSAFVSTRAVSFTHDWTVNVTARMAPLVWGAHTADVRERVTLGLSTTKDPTKVTGQQLGIILLWSNTGGSSTSLGTSYYRQGVNEGGNGSGSSAATTFSGSKNLTLSYSMAADKLTLNDGQKSVTYGGIKTLVNGSGYLTIMGEILWRNASNPNVAQVPSTNLNVSIAFNSMSLPHLTPEIKEIKMYRVGSATPIGADEYVAPGTPVRVEVVLRNTHAAGGAEEFPFHLKLLGSTHAKYPTVGMTASGDVITSAGQAVTLKAAAETKVTFNATVNGSVGKAVTIGLQLVEDSFGGTYEAGVKLLNEHPLKPGDGSGSGAAGTDYHYTRLPAPNANGWNTSPVTVTFYPGDFDQMTLTPSEGAAKVLTGADPAWTRSEDTAGISLSAQAKDTDSGAVSTQRAGLVKIDTSAPRIEGGGALGYTLTDVPADASKATSGIWRLHRTGASGAAAADGRAAAFREFPLTDGNGTASQAVGNLPNGYYVAEDAAGNLSAPLKVSSTEPPAVERPAGSLAGPGDPGYAPPVGPPLGPGSDPVPGPTVAEDAGGLRHAVIEESVSQMIDPSAPPFGGLLEPAEATAMMDYRYAASSTAAPTTKVDALLGAAGDPIASFDTKVPGECTVKRVITDAQGNTTTILLHYSTIRDNCPVVRPLQPSDPADPDSPKVPGDPLSPSGPVTTDPDGTQHVTVDCEASEAVRSGAMDRDGALALLQRHYDVAALDGAAATLTVRSMQDAAGAAVSSIDLSQPATYLITYVASDAQGNTTTVNLTYRLMRWKSPEVKPPPTTTDPDPKPLEPPEPPHIHPDGTHHAVLYDKVRVLAQAGASLFLDAVRALMEGRYTFAATDGGTTAERSLALTNAAGSAVSSIDLSREGTYHIAYTRADAAGNTTTVHLTYEVFRDQCPPIRPLEPVDPTDPTGDKKPGDPLQPSEPVTEGADGTQSTSVDCSVTEAVTHGVMDKVGAQALLRRHFLPSGVDGGDVTVTVQSMANAAGDLISAIDLSRQAHYRITYVVRDGAGNTTTVRLAYHLISSRVPGVMATPDPDEVTDLIPGDPLNPQPHPLDPTHPPTVAADGTQHAEVADEMRVPVKRGAELTLADARSLVSHRYTFTPEAAGTVSEVSLAMADGSGGPVRSIDLSYPSAWRINYKVRDANGNTVKVNLRYLVVAKPPTVTPGKPGGDGGPGEGNGSSGRDPLPPSSVTVDPETGLTHAVINDEVTVPTEDDPMTPAAMASFMEARYGAASGLPDGKLTRGTPQLYDSAGKAVTAIDRSRPGDWRADQVITDSAGDTVSIRLTYLVREGTVTGGTSGGNGSSGAGDGGGTGDGSGAQAGAGGANGDGDGRGRWASRIHQLPQTGGIFGPCPVHILFVLIMLLSAAYTLARLRQEAAHRAERRRRDAEWEEFYREAVR